METYTEDELKGILTNHQLWLADEGGFKANLYKANLYKANLYKANLSYAYLSNANLSYAYLSNANLSNANLSNANLYKANLYKANLTGSKGICKIDSEYPYQTYCYNYAGENRIRFACHDRTVDEWENDFYNNDKEFPKGSYLAKVRLFLFESYKNWFKLTNWS